MLWAPIFIVIFFFLSLFFLILYYLDNEEACDYGHMMCHIVWLL